MANGWCSPPRVEASQRFSSDERAVRGDSRWGHPPVADRWVQSTSRQNDATAQSGGSHVGCGKWVVQSAPCGSVTAVFVRRTRCSRRLPLRAPVCCKSMGSIRPAPERRYDAIGWFARRLGRMGGVIRLARKHHSDFRQTNERFAVTPIDGVGRSGWATQSAPCGSVTAFFVRQTSCSRRLLLRAPPVADRWGQSVLRQNDATAQSVSHARVAAAFVRRTRRKRVLPLGRRHGVGIAGDVDQRARGDEREPCSASVGVTRAGHILVANTALALPVMSINALVVMNGSPARQASE